VFSRFLRQRAEDAMFNGNFYGLIITLLTLVIAIVLTARQVQETGIRFEVTIQRVDGYVAEKTPERKGEQEREPAIASGVQRSIE
jgi:hypothetical protein